MLSITAERAVAGLPCRRHYMPSGFQRPIKSQQICLTGNLDVTSVLEAGRLTRFTAIV